MSGPFGVRMTLISGGPRSGEVVVAAATFLSMTFLTMDCVCTDRHGRSGFMAALKGFTASRGMDVYQGPDFFAKALVGPGNSLSTKGLFWLALDRAGERLARDIVSANGEPDDGRVYHSVHKLNWIERPISPPPETSRPVEEKAYFVWLEALYEAMLPWREIIKSIQSDFS